MSFKKRLLRILLVLTVVLLFAGYFAFTTLFFSPLEGDYEYDVSTLAPRDVDFFVAKARLAGDFAEFPRPALLDRLEKSGTWLRFLRSEEYGALEREHDLPALFARLEELPRQVGGFDPLDLFGGEDLAVAGYLKGPAQAEVAVYGRASWMAKVALEALRYPALLALVPGFERQGLQVSEGEGWIELVGGALQRPLYLVRIRDVIVAATTPDLARKALDLEARGGQDSFGQGAMYHDRIAQAPRGPAGDEIELYVDWRRLSEARQIGGRWPDPESQEFLTALAGRLFQVGSVRSLAGVVGFDQGLNARIAGDLSSELMTPVQTRIYRERGVERAELLREAARMAPATSALFLYLQMDLGDFLREALGAAEKELRNNLEDTLRATGQYPSTEKLIDELDALFKGRAALIVRDFDYAQRDDDPPHDDAIVPAWAVVLWHDDSDAARAKIKGYHDLVNRNQQRFGIEGREPGQAGVFTNEVGGGFLIWEFWSKFVPGTGHVATWPDGPRYVVSNSYQLLHQLTNVFHQGAPQRLSERPEFVELAQEGLAEANVVLWVNPPQLAVHLEKLAAEEARDQVFERVDYQAMRLQYERQVLKESFPGVGIGSVPPDVQLELNEKVNVLIEAHERKLEEEQVPQARARIDRRLEYLRACAGVLAMVSLDPKRFEVSVGVIVPLPQEP